MLFLFICKNRKGFLNMKFYNEQMRLIRKEKRISVQFLAKSFPITTRTVYAWERGETVPSSSDIRILALLLEVPVRDISDLKELVSRNSWPHDSRFYEDVDRNLYLIDKSIKELNSNFPTTFTTPILALKHHTQKLFSENHRINMELDKLSTIFNSLDYLIYTKDAQLKIKNVNDAMANYLNRIKGDIIGHTFTDFFGFNNQSVNDTCALENKVFYTKVSTLHEKIIIPGNNGQKTGVFSVFPVTDKSGKVVEIICSIRDTTLETNLQQKQDQLEDAVNNLEDAVLIIDLKPTPHIAFSGGGTSVVYGRTPSEFYSNKNLYKEILHPEDKKRVISEWDSALKNNQYPLKQEYRIIHQDGSTKYVESKLFKDENRNILFGRVSDITDNKQQKQRLEAILSTLDASDDAIQITEFKENEKKCIYINPANKTLYEIPITTIIKNPDIWKQYVHSSDLEKVLEIDKEKNEKQLRLNYRLQLPDKKIKYIEERMFRKNIDNVLYTGTIRRDVTENKINTLTNDAIIKTLDTATDAIWIAVSDLEQKNPKNIYMNQARADLYERNLEEIMNDPHFWKTNIHPEDYKRLIKEAKTIRGGKVFQKFRLVFPNGRIKYVIERKSKIVIDNTKYSCGIQTVVSEKVYNNYD